MARVKPLAAEAVEPMLASLVDAAQERLPQFMNQVLTLAHRPPIAHDLVSMYLGFQDNSSVDRRYIKLAILTVSYLNRCAYCVSHHAPLGRQAGLSPAALADLESGIYAQSTHLCP